MAESIDFDKLLAQSMEELRLKTQAHDGTWHLSEADWSVDQDEGQIVFDHKGTSATAPVQIVGTFNTEDSTWLWGWEHPAVVPATPGACRARPRVWAGARSFAVDDAKTRLLGKRGVGIRGPGLQTLRGSGRLSRRPRARPWCS